MTRKSAIAACIIAFLSVLIAGTLPTLLHNTRIGLEFKGGYEILYVAQPINAAEPINAAQPVTKAEMLKTAEILSRRTNALGVAEPDVVIEGQNLIRIKLAGVSSHDAVRSRLTQPESLPLKLTEKYSQTVGGVLGEADLRDTLKAGLIALALIFGFMALVYRIPGLIAIFCLVTYLWLLLVIFNALHAQLSLAAIVAFVLGIGIASDANILSFERIREELGMGKPLKSAVKSGEHHALRTILDSNATGLIGAVVLFVVGIGPIRGFALTTILSIVVSLISNVLLARLLLNLLVSNSLAKTSWFPTKAATAKPHSPFDFVKYRFIFLGLSGIFALVGSWTLLTTPLNLDIDFKAGTALDVTISQAIDQEKATRLIEDTGVSPATVAIAGDKSNQIAVRFDDVLQADEINQVVDGFKKEYGADVAFQENTADPAVARELVNKAIYAVGFSVLGVFVFVLWRFGWQYAIAAVAGILNSGFFVLCVFAVFKYEIDVTFIAAILTVIGYATNDTIVVFDRIRENLKCLSRQESPPAIIDITTDLPVESAYRHHRSELQGLVNDSIWQVVRRSIYTVLTVIAGSLSLFYWGAEPLHAFALAILFGLVCGAYSSIFIAAPLYFALKVSSGQEMMRSFSITHHGQTNSRD